MAKRRILVVENDADVAGELASRLVALGYEVVAIASRGDEADSLATRTTPDLVLMGTLPDADPHAVADGDPARRKLPIPIVFVVTDEEEAALRDAGWAEPNGFLAPPFTNRELATSIELVLCRHQAVTTVHEMEAFFSEAADMFCFLDFNGHFRRLNPAWERTLGYTREELMAKRFIEFVHPDDRERTLKQNANVREGGQATGFENRYRCKDGSYRWLLWNASPRSGQSVIYSVARDITARKEAEIERTKLLRALEASLAEVRSLRDILPICMYCKKIRDDTDYWHSVEVYISEHTNTRFSHGICPTCMETEVEAQYRPDKS